MVSQSPFPNFVPSAFAGAHTLGLVRAACARFNDSMPEPTRQKITLREMRASGGRGLLIYCSDYHCSHWTAISGDRWPDDVRLSDLECRRPAEFRLGTRGKSCEGF